MNHSEINAHLTIAKELSGPELEEFLASLTSEQRAAVEARIRQPDNGTDLDQTATFKKDQIDNGTAPTVVPDQQHQAGPNPLERTFISDSVTTDGSKAGPRSGNLESRYQVIRPHARGGLGEVFVAQDLELNREVALKEIQSQFADHQDSRSRFVLEAEVTGGLEHPGIVPVYGLGQYQDGRPYYAMRFIKGDSLKEAIAEYHSATDISESDKSLRLRKLLGRFVDVCQAISYAHSRGVLHRDLKPGNIMLGKYGETLVVDWGLAKVAGHADLGPDQPTEEQLEPTSGSNVSATVMGSAIGTPAYMPPEQAAGRLDELGPASDVYSLGATLYHLLTGTSPFPNRDLFTTLKDVQEGKFARPREACLTVPRPIEAVCLKAMALKQADRYPSQKNWQMTSRDFWLTNRSPQWSSQCQLKLVGG